MSRNPLHRTVNAKELAPGGNPELGNEREESQDLRYGTFKTPYESIVR
jgi:hypothetical protein